MYLLSGYSDRGNCMSMQFVIVVWLTVPSTGLRSVLATMMGANGSACEKSWLECFHLSINAISIWLAVCAWPACVQHALARPAHSLYTCVSYTFCVISCGLRFSHTFSWQPCQGNWSTFYMCTHSVSPYNVMHSSSYIYGSRGQIS